MPTAPHPACTGRGSATVAIGRTFLVVVLVVVLLVRVVLVLVGVGVRVVLVLALVIMVLLLLLGMMKGVVLGIVVVVVVLVVMLLLVLLVVGVVLVILVGVVVLLLLVLVVLVVVVMLLVVVLCGREVSRVVRRCCVGRSFVVPRHGSTSLEAHLTPISAFQMMVIPLPANRYHPLSRRSSPAMQRGSRLYCLCGGGGGGGCGVAVVGWGVRAAPRPWLELAPAAHDPQVRNAGPLLLLLDVS